MINSLLLIKNQMEKRAFTEIEVDESTNQGSYGYIESKALRFLEVGYQEYTKNDAFNQPGTKLSPGIMQMLTSGCEQIRDNKGEKIKITDGMVIFLTIDHDHYDDAPVNISISTGSKENPGTDVVS